MDITNLKSPNVLAVSLQISSYDNLCDGWWVRTMNAAAYSLETETAVLWFLYRKEDNRGNTRKHSWLGCQVIE